MPRTQDTSVTINDPDEDDEGAVQVCLRFQTGLTNGHLRKVVANLRTAADFLAARCSAEGGVNGPGLLGGELVFQVPVPDPAKEEG